MRTNRTADRASAFSLIEVMVASAVLSVVMAILLGTLTASMALWRNTENKLAADREGRAGELLIAQDLANALVPAATGLWPDVVTNGGTVFLRFLTTKPLDYQRPGEGNVGDVCFVQYFISDDGSALYRSFNPSAWTYENVIKTGAFPPPATNEAQMLATNLLANPRDSVRGISALFGEASTNTFVVLATNNPGQAGNLLPRENKAANNPPAAIEVNFAVADPDAIANEDLLDNPDYKLRNAGYYSFRVPLPRPSR